MAGRRRPERGGEKCTLRRIQARQHGDEVGLIDRPRVLRLVQQLDLGPNVRDAVGGDAAEIVRTHTDVRVAAVRPAIAAALFHQDLELPRLVPALAAPELVRALRQRLSLAPWREGAGLRDEELPPLERAPHRREIVPEDRDLNVGVRARRASDEEVERPATGDPPARAQLPQTIAHLLGCERLPFEELGRGGECLRGHRCLRSSSW